jgi:integrase
VSVEKRGNVYRVRWREHGRNRSRTFARRRDAELFDSEKRREKALGLTLIRDDRTLEEYAETWREHRRVSPQTAGIYDHQLDRRIAPWLGHLPVRELDPPTIKDWIARLRRDGVGAPSILKATTVLSAIMRDAVEDGLLAVNPVRQVRKPPQRRTRQPVMIAPRLVEGMRSYLLDRKGAERPLRDATLVSVLAYAGPRPESEALPALWRQVGKRTITWRRTKGRGEIVERHGRLLAPLAQDLREYRMSSGNPRAGLIFPGHDDALWTATAWDNWRERVFAKAAAHVGLPPDTRPRDLRSSFASLLIAEGWSIIAVAEQMGHTPRTLLKDYAGLFAEFDPAERIDAEAHIRDLRHRAAA